MRLADALVQAGNACALAIIALSMLVASGVSARADETGSPSLGTPSAGDPSGCDRLPAYFGAANALIADNMGLAILETVDRDVLALTDEQADDVVASLDSLLSDWDALMPPPAAQEWHDANRDLFAWYRDMAANRGHLDHQRLINGDRTIVPALGRATFAGQQACGYERWNDALTTAPASAATPAP
ncbi:MAG: hypothetical protein QM589_18175 [Thermomicrobiales bacterium]